MVRSIFHTNGIPYLFVSHNFSRVNAGFFLSRTVSEWSVNEMSENGLCMTCDLRLRLVFILAEKKEGIRFVEYFNDRFVTLL